MNTYQCSSMVLMRNSFNECSQLLDNPSLEYHLRLSSLIKQWLPLVLLYCYFYYFFSPSSSILHSKPATSRMAPSRPVTCRVLA
jgi:hypothetical protein